MSSFVKEHQILTIHHLQKESRLACSLLAVEGRALKEMRFLETLEAVEAQDQDSCQVLRVPLLAEGAEAREVLQQGFLVDSCRMRSWQLVVLS
jgi:hypothetical protein